MEGFSPQEIVVEGPIGPPYYVCISQSKVIHVYMCAFRYMYIYVHTCIYMYMHCVIMHIHSTLHMYIHERFVWMHDILKPCVIVFFAQTDPELKPVNMMETRNVMPQSPLIPPKIVLPGGLGVFNPKPEVMCCTMNAVPTTSNLLGKMKLPLAMHIHPFKDLSTQV